MSAQYNLEIISNRTSNVYLDNKKSSHLNTISCTSQVKGST